jgi:hypothetical protein
MKHKLLCLGILTALVGCLDPNDGGSGYGYQPPGPRGPRRCEQFTTCGTCTPVLGCGWCWTGDKGLCTDQPNACAGATSFDWTWDLAECPATGDGGAAGASDAGHDGGTEAHDAESHADASG